MLLEVLDWRSSPFPGNMPTELAVARGAGGAGDWRRPFRSMPFYLDLGPDLDLDVDLDVNLDLDLDLDLD